MMLKGRAMFSGAGVAEQVFVYEESRPAVVLNPKLDPQGFWWQPVPPGRYFVIRQRIGCPPDLQGPYTLIQE